MKAFLPSFQLSWTPHFEGDKDVLFCHQHPHKREHSADSVLQLATEILDLGIVSEHLEWL